MRILHSISELQGSVTSLISLIQIYREFNTIQTYVEKNHSLSDFKIFGRHNSHLNIPLSPLLNSYCIYFPFFIQIADLPMIRTLCGINSASWPDLRHWFLYSGLSIPLKSLLSSLSSSLPQPPSGSTMTPGLLKLRSLFFVAKQPLTKQYFPEISMHLL